MAYAASRYTEVKLAPICAEIFKYIDKDTVDFVPNYDNSQTEPLLLPTTFPNILVNPNQGIAVGTVSYTHLDVYKRQIPKIDHQMLSQNYPSQFSSLLNILHSVDTKCTKSSFKPIRQTK